MLGSDEKHGVIDYALLRRTRTITERIAKRIRRGQRWGRSIVGDEVILRWAMQYSMRR